MGMRMKRWAGVFLVVALAASGCPAKKKGPGAAGSGLTDEGIAAGGSLDQYRSGAAVGKGGGPLQDAYFTFDSFDLDESARQALRDNASWMKDNGKARVEIEGHCDERGTVEYNLALGAKRARAAKDYLVTLGIAAERLTTISYGEELPACREHNESCWQQNRRGHFVVLRD